MSPHTKPRANERGQIVVIVAAGMIVIVALVGLVIDGGFAWGQQRRTQNGADAMAEAAATVIAHSLKGVPKTDGDVGCALENVAAANEIETPGGQYTDWQGLFITPATAVGPCNPGGGAAIPPGAQGVKASGTREFDTFLAQVIGFDRFTAGANATAVAGILTDICPAGSGCAVLPVTFPLTAVTCDGTNRQLQIPNTDWPLVQVVDPSLPNYATTANEAIIPLCVVGPGSVGWLDLGPQCGNLSQTITDPCNVSIPIPTWINNKTGNVNALEAELNAFAGPLLGVPDDSIVLIPINDNTCDTRPPDDQPDCPGGNGSGTGTSLFYHIPKFTRFMIDRAFVQGGNVGECNIGPGTPLVQGSGGTGCFKGWFVDYVEKGPVGPGATGPQDPGQIGIQLIR
jgi:hypothetical protein